MVNILILRRCRVALMVLIFVLLSRHSVFAQTIPVGMPVLEEHLRRSQLQGDLDSTISFTVRPMFRVSKSTGSGQIPDSILTAESRWFNWNGVRSLKNGRGKIQILPVTWEQIYTSHHPYGWNEGSIIPARGYQHRISAGVFAKYGPVSVQLRPEFVHAENKDFEGFNTEHADIIWRDYYFLFLNQSDIPERFGERSFEQVHWGQSSIRLTFDPISFGLSSENLWWGPGRRSSLLMSNNSPGFKHLTLNTTKPVKSPIGSFEGQIVAGRLENSGYLPPEPNRTVNGRRLFSPKKDDWRYLSGIVLTYQPKWTPGLFLGFARAFQVYGTDLDRKIGDYLPILQPFQKKNTSEYFRERDQLVSIFTRYLLPESKAEVYFEYGFNDHSEDLRDFLLDPEHSRAYLVGFSKLLSLNRKDEFIQADLEFTQLSQGASSLLRDAGAWYVHGKIRQGYTNEGQVMGAGIGPGSNLQSFSISWNKKLKGIGLQFERLVRNNDFYNLAWAHNKDFRKRWVDLSASANVEWDYKNLLINARASVIRSLNYQYWLIDRPWEGIYFQSGYDVFNFQGQLGITYRF